MKHKIHEALATFSTTSLYDASSGLLHVLGYQSEKDAKAIPMPSLGDEVLECVGLFQITDEEVGGIQGGKFDDKEIYSFLFVAVALKKEHYNRSFFSSLTRELNKAFCMPVIPLFYYSHKLTWVIVDRRVHKKESTKDVLQKITIIKDVSTCKPHPAHLQILEKLTLQKQKAKTFVELFDAWQKTLNISIVTKEFYTKLFTLFTELQNSIIYPNESQKEFFIITLLGRILFLRFLHAKGLIPDEKFEVKSGYYHEVLELLFFEVLNKPLEKRRVTCKEPNIPFLNGGLFEESTNDHYKFSDLAQISENLGILKIPEAWFVSLYALFDNYIFTVDENTASDVEVALDPELLGRVFENLLASINPETKESARKATGSYYTPREIVDYMVSSSLKEYLKTKTTINETKLESLCFNKTCDFEPIEKTQILQAIFELKVLDPACGSGAFPMGLLNHLVAMLDAIDFKEDEWFSLQSKEFKEKHKNRDKNYIRKLSIIQNSIFGVDIQPIAIEISKLRFFLSLIVDESHDKIEPLPNMEFKFVCANTLLPLQKKGQVALFADDYTLIEKELKDIKEAYFNTTNKDEKEQLRKAFLDNLKALRHEIGLDFDNKLDSYNPFDVTSSAKFFDSDYMFGISKGFDIVIGNPPYIGEKGNKETFAPLKKLKYYQGKMDLFYFFFHVGLDNLKNGGILSLITTNYYITATGAVKLRNDFKERSTILNLINFNELKIFESALGQHNLITTLQKGKFDKLAHTSIVNAKGYLGTEVLQSIIEGKNKDTSYYQITQEKLFNGGNIQLTSGGIDDVLDKLNIISKPLGNIVQINRGVDITCRSITKKHIKLYPNAGYIEGEDVFSVKRNFHSDICKDYIKSSDISRYIYRLNDKKLLYITWNTDIEKYQEIKSHLIKFKPLLEKQMDNYGESYPWFALHRARNKIIFESEKILVPYRAESNFFGYSNQPLYGSDDVYFVTKPKDGYSLKFLLAILNSKLTYKWLYYRGKRKGEMLELYQEPLSKIPIIKDVGKETQQPFITLVDKILTCKARNPKANTSELEAKIDKMVYQLYGLNKEEIAIIEGKE